LSIGPYSRHFRFDMSRFSLALLRRLQRVAGAEQTIHGDELG
jgi:hypothetical protein